MKKADVYAGRIYVYIRTDVLRHTCVGAERETIDSRRAVAAAGFIRQRPCAGARRAFNRLVTRARGFLFLFLSSACIYRGKGGKDERCDVAL